MKHSEPETDEAHVDADRLSYAHEKLAVAVWKLATGAEGVKARLADAFMELVVLQESDFPPELRDLWRQIRSALTSGKMQYDRVIRDGEIVEVPAGRLYSTLRFMRVEKAQLIARQICELDSRLDDYFESDVPEDPL